MLLQLAIVDQFRDICTFIFSFTSTLHTTLYFFFIHAPRNLNFYATPAAAATTRSVPHKSLSTYIKRWILAATVPLPLSLPSPLCLPAALLDTCNASSKQQQLQLFLTSRSTRRCLVDVDATTCCCSTLKSCGLAQFETFLLSLYFTVVARSVVGAEGGETVKVFAGSWQRKF